MLVMCMVIIHPVLGATNKYSKVKYTRPFSGLFLTAGASLSIIPQLTLSSPVIVQTDSTKRKVTDVKNITNSSTSFFSPIIGIGYVFPHEISLMSTFSMNTLSVPHDKLVISEQFHIEQSALEISLIKYFNLTNLIKPFIGVSVGGATIQYSLRGLKQIDEDGNILNKRAVPLANSQVRQLVDFNQFAFYVQDTKSGQSKSSNKVCVVESIGNTCKSVQYLNGKNILDFGYTKNDTPVKILLGDATGDGNVETEKNNSAFLGVQGGLAFRHCNMQLEIFGTVRFQDTRLKLQNNLFGSYDIQNKLVNTYTHENITKILDDRGRYYVIPVQEDGECSTFTENQACNSLNNDLSDMPTAFLQGGQLMKLELGAIRYFFTEEYKAAIESIKTDSKTMIIDGDIVQNINYSVGTRLSVSF
ncbi:hypothetical protein Fokcrypt_00144 [Candidatus Fokinia cryptica]|uniref:Uncharacterized protein n=2 Tax=Candidatus Fokinia crypta TaxID=1920990 RepID=A0ABZ0URW8_9RICK|nr:hypothetical protein Fokcrypt_00144 [Candidatus Fokinia cryptica]